MAMVISLTLFLSPSRSLAPHILPSHLGKAPSSAVVLFSTICSGHMRVFSVTFVFLLKFKLRFCFVSEIVTVTRPFCGYAPLFIFKKRDGGRHG